MSQLNEKQIKTIIPAALAGDENAKDTLFQYIRPQAEKYIRRKLLNHPDVEDVVQEVMLAVWETLPRFNGQSKFSTYVRSIARNKVVDYCRRQAQDNGQQNGNDNGKQKPLHLLNEGEDEGDEPNADAIHGNGRYLSVEELEEILPSSEPLPDDIVEQKELREQLNDALDTLDPQLREVVRLNAYEDLNNSEIARRFGVNRSTVGRWLHTAYKQLNGVLTNQGIALV
jgi:RNA polymerase sigma factor (sigma-70 family)